MYLAKGMDVFLPLFNPDAMTSEVNYRRDSVSRVHDGGLKVEVKSGKTIETTQLGEVF